MSSPEQNAQTLRNAYLKWDACKGSELAMWDELVTEDFALQSLAMGGYGLKFSAPRSGRAELRDYLTTLTATFQMQHWTLEDTVAEGDRVVGIGRTAWTHRQTGKSVETPVVVVVRFRDGLMSEYHEFYDTAAVAGAAS